MRRIAAAELLYLILALHDWSNGWAEVSVFPAMLRYAPGDRALIPYAVAVLSKWSPLVGLSLLARAGVRVWLLAPMMAVVAIPHLFDGARAVATFGEFDAGSLACFTSWQG